MKTMTKLMRKMAVKVLGEEMVEYLETRKEADSNPYSSVYHSQLFDTALKALKAYAVFTVDPEFFMIMKLLETWLNKKKKQHEEKALKEQYHSPYEQESVQDDPYGFGSYTYY